MASEKKKQTGEKFKDGEKVTTFDGDEGVVKEFVGGSIYKVKVASEEIYRRVDELLSGHNLSVHIKK